MNQYELYDRSMKFEDNWNENIKGHHNECRRNRCFEVRTVERNLKNRKKYEAKD